MRRENNERKMTGVRKGEKGEMRERGGECQRINGERDERRTMKLGERGTSHFLFLSRRGDIFVLTDFEAFSHYILNL